MALEIGKLHLLVLHFPLTLILVTALADALWLWRRKPIFQQAGFFCLMLGAAAAVPTMITGFLLLGSLQLKPPEADLGELHESLGIMTTMVAALAAVVRVAFRDRLTGARAWIYGLLIVASVVLVAVTAHYGGKLAFNWL